MTETEEVRRAQVLDYVRVHIMMNDDYYYDPYQEQTGPSSLRWLVFVLILILGPIGAIGIAIMTPLEMMPLYMVFWIPMVVFGLYISYRWAQGKPVDSADRSEDERILESMRKHALPAQSTSEPDTFGCPNCGNLFQSVNAMPVDDNVVKCPFCDTRLYLSE